MIVRQPSDLDEWRRQWRAYRVLLALHEIGLLDHVKDGEAHALDTLADRLGVDERALDIAVRIVAARGLLVLDGDRVLAAPALKELGGAIAGLARDREDDFHLQDLAPILRSGEALRITEGGVVPTDPERTRRFLGMLWSFSQTGAEEAARMIREVAEEVEAPRILDLGGGHGRYAATLAEEVPGSRVTLFDREVVLPIARELSGDTFEVRGGNFHTDDLGGPYDVAFLSNIVHGEGEAGCRDLFARLREAIVPGGYLVLKDMFLDDNGVTPELAADFGLIMLLFTRDGRSWPLHDLRRLLADTGFTQTRHVAILAANHGYLVAR